MSSFFNWYKKLTLTHLLLFLLFLASTNLIKTTLNKRKSPVENVVIRDKSGELQSTFSNHPGTSIAIKMKNSDHIFTMSRPQEEDTGLAREAGWVVCHYGDGYEQEQHACCIIGADSNEVKSCALGLTSPMGVGILVLASMIVPSSWFVIRRLVFHVKKQKTRDLAKGKENVPISVSSEADLEFHYVPCQMHRLGEMVVDRDIENMGFCLCEEKCADGHCGCKNDQYEGCAYNEDGTLKECHSPTMQVIYECTVACKCPWNCRNRVAQKGMVCRLEVFYTVDRGWGVRALQAIPKGTFICEYAGEVVPKKQKEGRRDSTYFFGLSRRFRIDAKFYGNVARFFNHSCSPNLVPLRVLWDHQDERFCHICFYANRDIDKQEELAIDYGEKYWILRYIKGRETSCKCGCLPCKYSSEKVEELAKDYLQRRMDRKEIQMRKMKKVPGKKKTKKHNFMGVK